MVRGESRRGAGTGTCRLEALGVSFSGAYHLQTLISHKMTPIAQLSMRSLMDLKYPTPDSHVYSPCVLPEYCTQK